MRNCFFIALAAMAAVACQKGTDNIGPEPTSFSATIESYDATRTFTDGSLQVKWSPEDYLNVWEGRRASDKYTITPASVGKNYADLVLVKAGSTSGFVAKLPANIGYYPYVENIACSSEGDGFKLENIVLPDTQTFAVNSFGNGFMPMVAVTKGQDDYDFSFRNVCGVLRIVLSGELLVKTISVTGNNDEIICGAAELFVGNASLPSITMIGDGKTVSLDCGEGVQVGSMTSFDIVLPPVTFSQGFTININDEVYFRTERQQVIARSHILSMGNKTLSSDLSAAGTANCYMVTSQGDYKFRTVKGNTDEPLSTVASAEVLWESFGTDIAPEVGDLVSEVSYSNGFISFKASDKKGNAVIAAKDEAGTILWSWHIWMTDKPVGQVYNNNVGTVMDRNLGATSTVPGDVHALGLLYQWGRKDPFLGASNISSSVIAKSTTEWPAPVASDPSCGTWSYAVMHPMTFITRCSNNFDWIYSNDPGMFISNRWLGEKGLLDPCPPGWKIPANEDSAGLWAIAAGTNSSGNRSGLFDATNRGMNLTSIFGADEEIWYPACGERSWSSGELINTGYEGLYWGKDWSPYVGYLKIRYTNYLGVGYYDNYSFPAGRSVRCISQDDAREVIVTSVTIDKAEETLSVGSSVKLNASVVPEDANVTKVKWTSSNASIATVNADGIVSAVAAGSCRITATSYNSKINSCSITVVE